MTKVINEQLSKKHLRSLCRSSPYIDMSNIRWKNVVLILRKKVAEENYFWLQEFLKLHFSVFTYSAKQIM